MNISTSSNKDYNQAVVTNQRWIHRNQLKCGMYVCALDVPWESTSFMFQGFFVETPEQVIEVQGQCEYVQVRTEKVAKKPMNSYKRMCGATRKSAGWAD